MKTVTIEVTQGCAVEYVEHFYTPDEADSSFRALLAAEMMPEVIRLYRHDIVTKRRSEQYSMDYFYNPPAKQSKDWTPLMLSIRRRMESVTGRLDGGLVQMYPDGKVGIGWHNDAGKPEVIASLSLGAEREFAFGLGYGTQLCRGLEDAPLSGRLRRSPAAPRSLAGCAARAIRAGLGL